MKIMDQPWYMRGFLAVKVGILAVLSLLVGAPIAMGANEVTTTILTNDEATEYIAEKTLRIALVRLAAYQFAEKHTLGANSGRLFQLTRYEHLTLPQNPLQEGTTPANTPMTISKVTAMSEQWGAVITMYDVPLLTIKHNVLQKAIELLGMQAAKVFEREMQRTLMSCTSVAWAGTSNADRTGLASGDHITSLDIQKAVAALRNAGAEDWSRTSSNTNSAYLKRIGGSGGGTDTAQATMGEPETGLIGLIDPYVEQDIVQDATFLLAAQYSNQRRLYQGEVGKWLGVVFVRSNLMPSISLLSSPSCAGATMTGFVATLHADDAYDITVTRIRKAYGIEEAVSAKIDVTTGGADQAIGVVLPVNTAYMYKVYIDVGDSAGVQYEVQTASSALTVTADDLQGPVFEGGQTIYITAPPAVTGNAAPVDPATGLTVHTTWIFGKEAFGVVELDKLQATLTPNTASDSDPLIQRRKAGWKAMFKCVIQNHDFIRLIESTSDFA
jgi:N4-gp56 family major capsid protein